MRLIIDQQRAAVRLLKEGNFSNRQIATMVKISPTTVQKLSELFQASPLLHMELSTLNNKEFTTYLGTAKNKVIQYHKPVPDFNYISRELKKRDMTLELLWQEFKELEPDGVSYSRLARLYREWCSLKHPSMRQFYKAGDSLFVDFCGRSMPITDPQTGIVRQCQVFVGVLGASGYMFAHVVESQQSKCWLECFIQLFQHLGGVPRQIITDNLKAAVIINTKERLELNRAFENFAEHYDIAIMPARPKHPKDKGLAEVSVKIVQMGVLAPLRNQKFFSIEELNREIQKRMEMINQKTTKRFTTSRFEQLLEIDLPALTPLPDQPYESCEWKYGVRVSEFYLIEWQASFYSVPYPYINTKVDLRITKSIIEVFYQRERISSHLLSEKCYQTFILPEHMHPNHLLQSTLTPEELLKWAASCGQSSQTYFEQIFNMNRGLAANLKATRGLKHWVIENKLIDQLEPACAYALALNILSVERLKSIIKNQSYLRLKSMPAISSALYQHQNIRGANYYAAGVV